MAEIRPIARTVTAADMCSDASSTAFRSAVTTSSIIAVLALVGFIEGYDLVITGSLLVLAKGPDPAGVRTSPLARGWVRPSCPVHRWLFPPRRYPITEVARQL